MTKREFPPLIILFLLISLFGLVAARDFGPDLQGEAIRGGKLYAAWDRILVDLSLPVGEHPLWTTQSANKNTGIYTWRCSTCHGWDYLGNKGAYSRGNEGFTGFPGVISVRDQPNKEILSWLDGTQNLSHNFSAYLGKQGLEDLTIFLSTQLIDLPLVINYNNNESLGNGIFGETLYKAECRSCHGIDGAKINFATAARPLFIGNQADDNPWKVVHLVRFGHLDAFAGTSKNYDWSVIDVADLLAYTQVLPTSNLPEPTPEHVVPIDFSEQGDTTSLVIAMIVLVMVILGGTSWSIIREKMGEE
ncbi:MAG: cytochrome c [Chloroflexota bacterium]